MEIVYRAIWAEFEGLNDRNGHIWKVVGEEKSVSWVGALNKGKRRECELTKKMFLHSDLLKLCLKKKRTSLTSSLTQLFFTFIKFVLRGNGVKIWRAINKSNCIIHMFDLR